MDGFFDKYGRVIIIAVAICFVLLYPTPMRNVVGSSINGFAGNFANKVGESLGTVKMPNGSDNITWETPDGVEVGKTIKIDNKQYDVLKQTGNNKFLVCKSMVDFHYDSCPTFNNSAKGTDSFNIYEGSDIDNYLEKTWYPSLSEQLRNAIELSEIFQSSYDYDNKTLEILTEKKYDTNYKGQKYNTLKRHVYLPSVEDLQNLPTSTKNTRDAIHTDNDKYVQYLGQSYGNVSTYTDGGAGTSPIPIGAECFMCPAFIVDLSKVDYELVK